MPPPRDNIIVEQTVSLPTWLYFALSDQSSRQATLGKRLFGLMVEDTNGERIRFERAILRTVIKLIPWELTHLTLMLPVPLWWDPDPDMRLGIIIVYALIAIYFLVIFLNRHRQSVHDIVARTIVVAK